MSKMIILKHFSCLQIVALARKTQSGGYLQCQRYLFPISYKTNVELPFCDRVISRHVHGSRHQVQKSRFEPDIMEACTSKISNAAPLVTLDFEKNHSIFRERKFWDVLRSLTILKLSGIEIIARSSLRLMKISRRILGKRGHERLMKSTVYGHFVAGNTQASVSNTVNRLRENGIRAIIASTVEADVGESSIREDNYDKCLSSVIEYIDIVGKVEPKHPMTATKFTGLLSPELLAKLTTLAKGEAVQSIEYISDRLQEDAVSDKMNRLFHTCAGYDNFKGSTVLPSALSRILNGSEQLSLAKGIKRLKIIGEAASATNVVLLIDAEFVHLNQGISIFTLAMMKTYNVTQPIVWNTYQCYLKNTYTNFVSELALARQFGVCFGAKIVRGAYMKHERESAQKQGIPDPVCTTFADTTINYGCVADHMLETIHQNDNKYAVIIASHNHESISHVINRMKQLGIANNDPRIRFGQILGIADHVSYNLSNLGYNVYKYSPCGEVDEVLPYLYRRVMENEAVLEKTKCEIRLLKKELICRIKNKLFLS